MKKRTLVIVIAILSVGAIAGIYLFNKEAPDTSETPAISSQAPGANSSGGTETKSSSHTKAEVATHNSKDDCWTIINDNVYDLTSYVSRHPGGDDILLACGTDGTTLFTDRTTADGETVGDGGSHSSSAASRLESLKIGTLSD